MRTNWKSYNLNAPFKWASLEKAYSSLFPSHEGRQAFPMRVALDDLIIQKRQCFLIANEDTLPWRKPKSVR